MSKSQKDQEATEAAATLREILKPGDTVKAMSDLDDSEDEQPDFPGPDDDLKVARAPSEPDFSGPADAARVDALAICPFPAAPAQAAETLRKRNIPRALREPLTRWPPGEDARMAIIDRTILVEAAGEVDSLRAANARLTEEVNLLRGKDDPRGAPQPDTAGPIVIEKHRHREAGEEEISFYACGPVRCSLSEAKTDAGVFGRAPGLLAENNLLRGKLLVVDLKAKTEEAARQRVEREAAEALEVASEESAVQRALVAEAERQRDLLADALVEAVPLIRHAVWGRTPYRDVAAGGAVSMRVDAALRAVGRL